MGSFMDYAFPAGAESDVSDDEWDVGCCSDKRSSRIKDAEAVVPCVEDDVSALKKAVSDGDVGTVKQLLDSGLDVETRLEFGWTPLMCAVSVANYDLVELLLDRGASANFSKDGRTALMASCTASAGEDRNARCVELLLSRHADPNVADRSGTTCLMLAARDGYSKVINLLASHGADVNVRDNGGYTALCVVARHGREAAALKLLQLGADKTVRTRSGRSPADLAATFGHAQVTRILASSSRAPAEETLSKFFKTGSEPPPSKESGTKLDDLELFLHGLDLGFLVDVMNENDVTWSELLTMERDDLEKMGVADPLHQQKVLSAVRQMHLDKVDLDTIGGLGAADGGSEELRDFLLAVRQQCCYLTETVQDVVNRFPRQASQLVFSLDSKKEARTICSQLVIQTKDLQKEVTCLRNLLCQMDDAGNRCQIPPPGFHGNRRMRHLAGVALSALGAGVLGFLCRAAYGRVAVPT